MNHDPRFRAARNAILEYLLGPGRRQPTPPRAEVPAPSAVTNEVAA